MVTENHVLLRQQFGNCFELMGHPAHRPFSQALTSRYLKQMCTKGALASLHLLSPIHSSCSSLLFFFTRSAFHHAVNLLPTPVNSSDRRRQRTASHRPPPDHCSPKQKQMTPVWQHVLAAPLSPQHGADVLCHKSLHCLTSAQGNLALSAL